MRSANRALIICLYLLMGPMAVTAQDSELEIAKETLEKYVENTESNSDYTDLSEQLEYLVRHPINLNMAVQEELSRISQLTPEHIQALLLHRQLYGKLTSIYELQVIAGFEPDFILTIKPYINILENLELSDLNYQSFRKNYHHEVAYLSQRRLEKSVGYKLPDSDRNAFRGSPYRHVVRYKASMGKNLSFGFNTEKDDGENLRNSFFSSYLQFLSTGKIRQLLIGDFQAAFGQGLCFGSGLTFGKSAFVLDVMRRQNGLRPNRAMNENEFLRGGGFIYKISAGIHLTAFYSLKKIDATTSEDSMNESRFTGLLNTGNYRNLPELSKKGILKRRIAGSNIEFKSGKLQIGLTMVHTKYGSEQSLDEKKSYQLYNNHVSAIQNYGTDYKLFHKNLLFFGEAAMNQDLKSFSFINGVIASLDKNFDISLLYRNYSMYYIPSITNAFGETQDNHNEKGLYMACSFTPIKNYKLNAYADIYHFNWLRYQVDAPSRGSDMMLELQFTKRRLFSWYVRYRNEQKQKNEAGTQIINRLELNRRQLLRFHLEIKINTSMTLKSRIEHVWYQRQFGKTLNGMLMLQDLQVQVFKNVKLLSRLMFFDVEDYNSRVYAFENDVMYSFSVPAFQNRGTRFYLLVKYKMNKNIHLCFRFARTSYENTESSGSGQDKINSNKTTDTSIQLLWAL